MHVLTRLHKSHHRFICIWAHVVPTHICLCPCECSQLEPLCIHTCAHKYTYIPSQILLYMNPCCASWHMFVPLRVLTPRTSLYTYIYSQVYIYQESYNGYVGISTRAVHSHDLFVPLRVLTLRTSLYTCMYWQDYINHITDSFVYEPMLCQLTYVCALASART